jgi:hypothetical protein
MHGKAQKIQIETQDRLHTDGQHAGKIIREEQLALSVQ